MSEDRYRVGSFEFKSRLFVGTGKYADFELMEGALDASECEVVTVAVRRDVLMPEGGKKADSILDHINLKRITVLPNTAGCFNAKDAIRSAKLSRELLEGLGNPGAKWVKIEVLADKKTLLPEPIGTLQATEELVEAGFEVLAYTNDDPILARRLKDAGATSVMPLGSPIGCGQGILNPGNISLCIEYLKEDDPGYPVIVDAGVGTASDVTIAMELGADGVLLNTGIAGARDPILMARAMAHAVQAGRDAYRAGRIPRKRYASASSPMEGVIAPTQ
ncbi:MAG: thiazole synthase [Phycisphaerales bacterium]|nr:MAG: thiazole synthase [Phycisphaerales bacterium]